MLNFFNVKLKNNKPFIFVSLSVFYNSFQEIIVKAISAFLFLLLKHFKLNHIFQVRLRINFERFC